MSSVVYQTFYPYNKFDDIQTISNLNKWMLSKEVLAQLFPKEREPVPEITVSENRSSQNVGSPHIFSSNVNENEPVVPKNCLNIAPPVQVIVPSRSSHFILPDKMDTLFWCLYISHYGEEKYLAIGNKYGNAEIAEKQKIMEVLKSNKNALKNLHRKITIGLYQEIMSDLMTNAKTSLLSLVAFSVYYKKNIILLNTINKTFLEYRYDDRSISTNNATDATDGSGELGPWLIIKYTENKKYGFFAEETEDISQLIREYIYIAAPDKPLRGISTYKMGELMEIAAKIPELAKISKLSKPDLYGKIWHHLLWT